ncbi:hypothetical protein [Azohydromonas australica]|uniref:hypothetical protein n=1 Tax=Azohydromonas australica TaxID=364039 RepID=UPI000425933F|nr:hypothetical protein [Azohydromonas australica]
MIFIDMRRSGIIGTTARHALQRQQAHSHDAAEAQQRLDGMCLLELRAFDVAARFQAFMELLDTPMTTPLYV